MNIEKRTGEIVPFDKQKIIDAINAAFIDVDGQIYENDTAADIATEIENIASLNPTPLKVETIQNLVETYLMGSERKDVAKAYIKYRYKKEIAREYKDDFIQAIEEKLMAKDVKNQNANVDENSFGGRIGETASYVTKDYALNFLVSDMARKNHINNRIYIHDLDAYAVGSHNCLSIPFDDLLAKGFNTRQTDVRPANSVGTAFQLVAVIFQLQSLQQFGGVSATHLDWTMVPYVRKSFYKHFLDGLSYIEEDNNSEIQTMKNSAKDMSIESELYKVQPRAYQYALDMTKKEINQAVEAMYHNLKIWA